MLFCVPVIGTSPLYTIRECVFGSRPVPQTHRKRLFVLTSRNAVRATAFFRRPPERVVELGAQVAM